MPPADWDPNWVFTHNVTAQENQVILGRVKDLVLQHLGEELAGSDEMVEYVATLITTHKKMSDVLFSIAEVLNEEVPNAQDESNVTFAFTQQLYSMAKQISSTFVPPLKVAPPAAAPSRLFSAAVAGVRHAAAAPSAKGDTIPAAANADTASSVPKDPTAEHRSRKRPHADVDDDSQGPRKIVVVKRSHEGAKGSASRLTEPSRGHSLPEYGRPGTAHVVREEHNEYTGVSRPAVRQSRPELGGGMADSTAAEGAGGHGHGMGYAGRGRGGSLPTQQQIQMALAIVSQMAAVGGMAGSPPLAARGGFAVRGGGRGRGGHHTLATRDTKWVNQSSVPCKFGEACRNNPCPFGHPERQATSGQAGAAGSSGVAKPVDDNLPRKSSKFSAPSS